MSVRTDALIFKTHDILGLANGTVSIHIKPLVIHQRILSTIPHLALRALLPVGLIDLLVIVVVGIKT